MRCTVYCTASAYDIPRLFQFLQPINNATLYRDVVHTQPKDEKKSKHDVFYFPYGITVFWGFTEAEEAEYLGNIKKFEKEPLTKIEVDEFTFAFGTKMAIQEDEVVLNKKDPALKLAISYAMAQSVKLTVFEETIARTVETCKQLPKDLALKGKISLTRKQTSQKMGELFLERNYVNLHTEILDTPEFFWEHAELEPTYRKIIHYLDVGKRVELLNRRLNLMHELFEILGNELNHQKTNRLEMTIIILIVIEVLIALLRDLFHII
jgi:uncharacterized Rmd1/YagE family protein